MNMCKFTRNVLIALTALAGLGLASCNQEAEEEMISYDSIESLSFTDGTYDVDVSITYYFSNEDIGDYENTLISEGPFTLSEGKYVFVTTSEKYKFSNKTVYDNYVEDMEEEEKASCTLDEENLTITMPVDNSDSDSQSGTLSELFAKFNSEDIVQEKQKILFSDKLIQQSKDGSVIITSIRMKQYALSSSSNEWYLRNDAKSTYKFTKK